MDEIREILLKHSRYIRDTLLPLVADGGSSKLNDRDIALVRTTLNEVNAIPVTLDLLRYSRIAKALAIIAMDPRWPAETAAKATRILDKWEKAFGRVDDLQADLWGPGGRLAGLKKVKRSLGVTRNKAKTSSSWSIDGSYDLSKAYAEGHLGFPIGAWWIKSVAAVRDGIIGPASRAITADKERAYAAVLKDGEETQVLANGLTRYITSGADRSVLQLSKPMIGDQRRAVRILRSSKLRSRLAPAAGLRYDGLYRVVSYGVYLSKNKQGEDVWTYAFSLQREYGQAGIKEALCHPTADELDDHRDYHRAKAANEIPGTDANVHPSADPTLTDSDGIKRHTSVDSGYHSIRGLDRTDSKATGSKGGEH